jgi:hypothetical protein
LGPSPSGKNQLIDRSQFILVWPPEATRVCAGGLFDQLRERISDRVVYANEMSVTMLNANFVEPAQMTPFPTSSPGSSSIEASSPAPQIPNRVTLLCKLAPCLVMPALPNRPFSHFDLDISPKFR